MITRKCEKKFIVKLFLFFLVVSVLLIKISIESIGTTNAGFISIAPTNAKSGNGLLDIEAQIFDLDGNPLDNVMTDEPFILKVTNTGDLPINYKIDTGETEHNDFSNWLLLDIDNLYTSSSSDSDFFYVSKDFLFPRHNVYEYVIGNENLKCGETDTWQILYSAELTLNPTFQENVTITSLSADLKLNLIAEQVPK